MTRSLRGSRQHSLGSGWSPPSLEPPAEWSSWRSMASPPSTWPMRGCLRGVSPRWLGWIAVAGGAGGAVSGVVQAYIGEPSAITTALGIAAPTIITLWLFTMGILLVRLGRQLRIANGASAAQEETIGTRHRTRGE